MTSSSSTSSSASSSSATHPLDEALQLTASPAATGQYEGQTHPGYWNMVGPFGGITAATLLQAGADGAQVVTTTATAVTAVRRETWSVGDVPMPQVPPPAEQKAIVAPLGAVEWLNRYEMRPIAGFIPRTWDGSGDHSLTQLWMRDTPPRPIDFVALSALADVFFPRVWLRRARQVPAGTVSITVYFHTTAEQLQATGTGFLLGQARGQEFRN